MDTFKFFLDLILIKNNQLIIFFIFLIPLTITTIILQNRNETQSTVLEFNHSDNLPNFNYKEFNDNNNVFELSNVIFVEKFANLISDQDFLFKIIKEKKYINKDELNKDANYDTEVRLEASKIKITKPIINRDQTMLYQSTLNPNYRLSFESKYLSGKNEYIDFYTFLFRNGIEQIYQEIRLDVEEIINILKLKKEREIERLMNLKNNSIEDTIFNYKKESNKLKESLNIALSASLDEISEYAVEISKNNDEEISGSETFLFGSKVIRAKLINVENKIETFINDPESNEEIYEISKKIRTLEQDDTDTYLDLTFDNLFKSMKENNILYFDVNRVKIDKVQLDSIVMVFISMVVSIFILFIFLFIKLFRHNYFEK